MERKVKSTYSFKLSENSIKIIESVPDEKAHRYWGKANRTQKLEYILRQYEYSQRNNT